MTAEREEALELAREAGFWGQTWDKNYEESFIMLVRLAKQRGAEEQKRMDAIKVEEETAHLDNQCCRQRPNTQPAIEEQP